MKRSVNRVLERTTGYRLQKAAGNAPPPRRRRSERLLTTPAFVLSTVRSGSTLLRVLLDSHSQMHAPHEMHLRDIEVKVTGKYVEKALREVKLDEAELRYVLWDWYLHRELARTGKPLLVNKTPSDVFIVDDIRACWPDARFIFLLRHPLEIARSRHKLRPQDSEKRNIAKVLQYGTALEDVRARLEGHTVRYEDLAADPAGETQRLCAFLGVPWEASMLDYGQTERRYRAGLGDWNEKIKSGRIQPPPPLPDPDEVPETLRPLTAAWGYLPAAAGAPAAAAPGA